MRYRASEIKIGPEEFKDREHLTEHLKAALQRKLRRKFRGQIHISDLEIIRELICIIIYSTSFFYKNAFINKGGYKYTTDTCFFYLGCCDHAAGLLGHFF